MTEAPTLPISIWVTGSAVPAAARRAGTFADMIRATVGRAWPGPWSIVDAADDTDYGYVLQAMGFAKDAEAIVNSLVRERARDEGQDTAALATIRVTSVLVTKEIPVAN